MKLAAPPLAQKTCAVIQQGQIGEGNVEALAYALMGIGHFLALRWLIWPTEEDGEQGREQDGQPDRGPSVMPEAVFETVMRFISRGLAPDDGD